MILEFFSALTLLLALLRIPAVHCVGCSPAYGLVHVGWDNQHEVQYQLDCTTWAYFCQDSGWGDEEATVVCRELGYNYGTSGFTPSGRMRGLIDSIDCSGNEGRLQDCHIVPAGSNQPVCTQIGTITSCHNFLLQVSVDVDRERLSEDESFNVCVRINGTLSQDITISLQTFDGSALAGFDYVEVGHKLHFVVSESPVQCVEIETVDDSLAETEEWFGIHVSAEQPLASVIDTQLHLHIEPSDSLSYCTEGSVTVVSDANNSSLQLVEMCSSEGVWSPVCDHDWTLEDATVVCRELGHEELGNIKHALESTVIDDVHGIPECSGDEDKLSLCMKTPRDEVECRPALVDCTAQSGRGEGDMETTRNDSESDKTITEDTDTTVRDRGENETSIGLGVIIAMVVVSLVVTVTLLVSAVIVIQLCRGKRRRKVLPRATSPGGMTQQTNTSHDENIIVNSLYVNFHTSLPESSMEHTYSPVFEPRPQVHEYAILEVSSPRLEENSNLYHVLEGDGVSPVQHHFTVFDEPRPL